VIHYPAFPYPITPGNAGAASAPQYGGDDPLLKQGDDLDGIQVAGKAAASARSAAVAASALPEFSLASRGTRMAGEPEAGS
jgi:hypothetical protein